MVVSGIHSVTKALEYGFGLKLYIASEKIASRLVSLRASAEKKGCEVFIGKLPDSTEGNASQGVVLEISRPKCLSEKKLYFQILETSETHFLLILDGVTDPRNFGACLRTAVSYGVTGVIIAKDNSAPLNEAAFKASSGAAAMVPIYEVVNLARCITNLKKRGIWVFGADVSADDLLDKAALSGNLALVMGSEGKGIRKNVKKNCDSLLRISLKNGELSLNVSVATGICLNEIYRQQQLES